MLLGRIDAPEAGTRKVKPIWILMKQEMTGWQWHQTDHMQIIWILLQIDNRASTSSLNYRLDALSGGMWTWVGPRKHV